MSRDSIRARNTREPSCRACGYWRSDATHLPAADCPEQPCAKPDEHHAYDGPDAAVWDEETAALLAVADAAQKVAGTYRVCVNDYGECRACYQGMGDHLDDCPIAALETALNAVEAMP